ncbi:MAG: GNAT family N-acetyltransferase [Lachnospiraceae bacterium]
MRRASCPKTCGNGGSAARKSGDAFPHRRSASACHAALSEEWTRDLVSNYGTSEDFARMGLGFVALRGEEMLAGASS